MEVPPEPEFITVDEAAALLRVGRHTVYEAIKSGNAPWAKKLGRIIRINRAALLRWFETEDTANAKVKRTARR